MRVRVHEPPSVSVPSVCLHAFLAGWSSLQTLLHLAVLNKVVWLHSGFSALSAPCGGGWGGEKERHEIEDLEYGMNSVSVEGALRGWRMVFRCL